MTAILESLATAVLIAEPGPVSVLEIGRIRVAALSAARDIGVSILSRSSRGNTGSGLLKKRRADHSKLP